MMMTTLSVFCSSAPSGAEKLSKTKRQEVNLSVCRSMGPRVRFTKEMLARLKIEIGIVLRFCRDPNKEEFNATIISSLLSTGRLREDWLAYADTHRLNL